MASLVFKTTLINGKPQIDFEPLRQQNKARKLNYKSIKQPHNLRQVPDRPFSPNDSIVEPNDKKPTCSRLKNKQPDSNNNNNKISKQTEASSRIRKQEVDSPQKPDEIDRNSKGKQKTNSEIPKKTNATRKKSENIFGLLNGLTSQWKKRESDDDQIVVSEKSDALKEAKKSKSAKFSLDAPKKSKPAQSRHQLDLAESDASDDSIGRGEKTRAEPHSKPRAKKRAVVRSDTDSDSAHTRNSRADERRRRQDVDENADDNADEYEAEIERVMQRVAREKRDELTEEQLVDLLADLYLEAKNTVKLEKHKTAKKLAKTKRRHRSSSNPPKNVAGHHHYDDYENTGDDDDDDDHHVANVNASKNQESSSSFFEKFGRDKDEERSGHRKSTSPHAPPLTILQRKQKQWNTERRGLDEIQAFNPFGRPGAGAPPPPLASTRSNGSSGAAAPEYHSDDAAETSKNRRDRHAKHRHRPPHHISDDEVNTPRSDRNVARRGNTGKKPPAGGHTRKHRWEDSDHDEEAQREAYDDDKEKEEEREPRKKQRQQQAAPRSTEFTALTAHSSSQAGGAGSNDWDFGRGRGLAGLMAGGEQGLSRDQLEEKREKQRREQESLRRQLDEAQRRKDAEKARKRKEDEEEERRIERERKRLAQQERDEEEKAREREQEKNRRLAELHRGVEREEERAREEKDRRRMESLAQRGHDTSRLREKKLLEEREKEDMHSQQQQHHQTQSFANQWASPRPTNPQLNTNRAQFATSLKLFGLDNERTRDEAGGVEPDDYNNYPDGGAHSNRSNPSNHAANEHINHKQMMANKKHVADEPARNQNQQRLNEDRIQELIERKIRQLEESLDNRDRQRERQWREEEEARTRHAATLSKNNLKNTRAQEKGRVPREADSQSKNPAHNFNTKNTNNNLTFKMEEKALPKRKKPLPINQRPRWGVGTGPVHMQDGNSSGGNAPVPPSKQKFVPASKRELVTDKQRQQREERRAQRIAYLMAQVQANENRLMTRGREGGAGGGGGGGGDGHDAIHSHRHRHEQHKPSDFVEETDDLANETRRSRSVLETQLKSTRITGRNNTTNNDNNNNNHHHNNNKASNNNDKRGGGATRRSGSMERMHGEYDGGRVASAKTNRSMARADVDWRLMGGDEAIVRTQDFLNPQEAEKPMPISREATGRRERARDGYLRGRNPGHYGNPMEFRLDEDRQTTDNTEKNASKDPLFNPDLITKQPTERQALILQQLEDIRQGLFKRQKDLQTNSASDDEYNNELSDG